jgi:hypothetical protein
MRIILEHWMPCSAHSSSGGIALGHRVVDDYLELVRALCRPNTVLATAYDLKVFFSVVEKGPLQVTRADLLRFIKRQRSPRSAKVMRFAHDRAPDGAATSVPRGRTVIAV